MLGGTSCTVAGDTTKKQTVDDGYWNSVSYSEPGDGCPCPQLDQKIERTDAGGNVIFGCEILQIELDIDARAVQ